MFREVDKRPFDILYARFEQQKSDVVAVATAFQEDSAGHLAPAKCGHIPSTRLRSPGSLLGIGPPAAVVRAMDGLKDLGNWDLRMTKENKLSSEPT